MPIPSPQELLDFSHKVVLVTGASQGIGAATALRFAQAGANLIVHYRSNAAAAQEVVSQIEAIGQKALALQADVQERAQVEQLLAQSLATFGKIDVLINNAGIYPLATVLEMTDAEWDAMLQANLTSVFLCTQLVGRQMVAQGQGGAIINISSIEAENPAPQHSHYSASKAAVAMYSRSAAQELGQYGIRVNLVSPGLIWREGIETQWPEGVARWQKAAPLQRLGQADDIADACLFLASPAARWITGVNLVVDGGVLTHQIY